MEWIMLLLAGGLEVTWAYAMKLSEGFSRLMPSVVTVVGYILSAVFLAMALKKEDWADPVDLSPEDPDVIRYLKGETVPSPDENRKGWRLFCTGGFPLGFVKQDGQRLKNMYLPGWRMQ